MTIIRAEMYEFQSSPTPKGGRYTVENRAIEGREDVSILAHPERWALRA